MPTCAMFGGNDNADFHGWQRRFKAGFGAKQSSKQPGSLGDTVKADVTEILWLDIGE